ncbi:MAG: glycosyltransferase [Prevotella sp.]|nr:glycosyltransferase [Prevotella sp.]
MKIILANKFYYRRGGDCVYTINLEELLKAHGHDVAIFSMQHPENLSSTWSKYFPSEVKFKLGVGMVEAFLRPFGTKEVRKKFCALLDDFKPDIVHLNNIHSQLSPTIAELAHDRGIKVVWTLHDYKLLCPRYDCLRNGKTICEECFTNKQNVLKYSCMKNSKLASLLSYKEAIKWTKERIESCTDIFICPSQFMADKMIRGGFDKNMFYTLCNFIDIAKCHKEDYERDDYYCFIGRLSQEKGVNTLVKAANQLPYKLKIIGGGPMVEDLKNVANSNIEFVGFKQWDEIKILVGKARFSVIPSEWYENNPLSVIEAQCLGTPVLGANIGGIPEIIKFGFNGLTFESGNVEDLKQKIQAMYDAMFDYKQIAIYACETYNAESYYSSIMNIYKN